CTILFRETNPAIVWDGRVSESDYARALDSQDRILMRMPIFTDSMTMLKAVQNASPPESELTDAHLHELRQAYPVTVQDDSLNVAKAESRWAKLRNRMDAYDPAKVAAVARQVEEQKERSAIAKGYFDFHIRLKEIRRNGEGRLTQR